MKDFLGREIELGDVVVWASPTSTRNFELKQGNVLKFIHRKDGEFVEIIYLYPASWTELKIGERHVRKRKDKVVVVPKSVDEYDNSELKFILAQRELS